MKKWIVYLLVFALGVFATLLFFKPSDSRADATKSRLLSYEIKKLNKMVVVEEYYSQYQEFEGSVLPKDLLKKYKFLKSIDHKMIAVLAKGTMQTSYDLKKMELELNDADKTITIQSLPDPDFQLFTEVEFLNLDTGMMNSLNAEELNEYKEYARNKIEKQVDKKELEKKAHQQLVENLSDIFVLAEALDYKIVDNTNISSDVNSYLQNL